MSLHMTGPFRLCGLGVEVNSSVQSLEGLFCFGVEVDIALLLTAPHIASLILVVVAA